MMLKGPWILICFFSMKCYSLEYPFLPMHGKTYTTDDNAVNTREGSTFSSGNDFAQNYNENTNYESSNNIESCDDFPNNYNNENEVDLTFMELTADGSQAAVVLCTEGPLSSPDCISERFVCSDGRWIKSLPFSSYDCGVPPPVANAKVYGVNTRELSHARYFCDPGFITMDKTLTVCYKNQWNLSPLPICLEPEAGCGNPKPLPNGRITRSLSTSTFLPSEVIKYTCRDGFVLNDPESEFSYCFIGNIWSLETDFKRFPECKRDCGSPPDVANASVKLSLTHVGSKAKYICDPGLITIDPAMNVCGDNGTWNLKKLPKCILPKSGCGNPRPLNNGVFLSFSPFMEDENITYVCNKGYKLLAPFGPFSTCTSKGSWSLEVKDKFPYCQSDCSKLPTAPRGGEYFIDGKVINQNESFGDEILITFACQKSFVMFRNASLYCKKGVWQWIKDGNKADPPLCGIDCGPLPTVLNAALHLTSTSAGSEAYYVCKTGFYTTDKTVSFCRVDGKWSLKSLPSCLSPTHGCGNPPWLINGRYDTVGYDGKWPIAEGGAITYSCEDGYSIIAPNGTINTCLAGNKWSLKDTSLNFPLCQSKCVSSDPIYHLKSLKFDGQTKGQIVVAGCTGHTIESDQTICNGDSWIPPKITCSSGCESPSLVKNATIIAINESFVSYVCDPGFITIDPTESFCSSNGSWDLNPLPKCLIPATGCGNPPTLLHGYYLGDPPYDKGEVVTYYCNKDFMPFAPNGFINTCMGANIWSQLNNFESFPKCLAFAAIGPTSFLLQK
ncbi:C4b-binding protein alpha chain-like [Clavelina lepadiformis]|uniref:C4b-binding protein alpha chain-like n=1 Tax=Clavelina lepadiformis TaxID=159417 RepID=UPI0040427231